ncbi:hypothetical protein [Paenibacillus sp. OSY-SE]|uniref:hypothetical protein n=1 Tax=Paenibacillus sp. OSY-SE TaxID=1196323 RepID=UPI0012F7E4FD|nr:hypothetical protein [Paenibacillus sp. OSY-SE]
MSLRISFAHSPHHSDCITLPLHTNRNQVWKVLKYRSEQVGQAGYPSVTVPAGYEHNGRPYNVTFLGKPYTEPASADAVCVRIRTGDAKAGRLE